MGLCTANNILTGNNWIACVPACWMTRRRTRPCWKHISQRVTPARPNSAAGNSSGPAHWARTSNRPRSDVTCVRPGMHALDSSTPRQRHAFAPYATAALLLIAVTVGIWTGQHWLQPQQPQLTAQAPHEVPDIYEDLDFYLWLAGQQDTESETHSDNPNNT